MYRKLSAPVAAQWEVTPTCNHSCRWCYNFWRNGKPLPALPSDYLNRYQCVVDEIILQKIFVAIITGGEPLLVIEKIAPYITQLTKAGVYIYLNSNLTLMTRQRAQILSDVGVKSILVSLPTADSEMCDYLTNTKDTVARTTAGIRIAREFGFPVMVNMVVSKSNLAHIQMTAGYVASLGITSFAATRASNPVAGSEFVSEVLDVNEFRMMLSELDIVSKKYGFRTDTIEANPPCAFGEDHIQRSHRYCGAGKNTCTIGYDGMVRACNRLPMTYGDITEGLSAAWSKMDDCRSDKNIPSECSACRLKTRCGGGCKADALVEYGDVKKPDPLCDFSYQPSPKASTLEPVTGTLFEINPKLQLRVEEFGAIAFISVSSWLAIDGRLLNLFTSGKEVIELSDIATVFSTTIESASKTAALLVKTHILIPID